jgi:hypothetical protein
MSIARNRGFRRDRGNRSPLRGKRLICCVSQTLYWLLTGLCLSVILSALVSSFFLDTAVAQTSPVPTVMARHSNAPMPDWSQITFATLPPISESGAFNAPAEALSLLGYDPSRSWSAGQTADSITKLGDFQDVFRLQDFSLDQIAQIVGLNLSKFSLSEFGLIAQSTLKGIVEAIPGLKEFPIKQVAPLTDLISQKFSGKVDPSQTLGQLLTDFPLVGDLSLGDLDLGQYNLDSIPGLESVPIGNLENWQASSISEIPGLADVPFSDFPSAISPVGMDVGIVDVVFGLAEEQRDRTISGSTVEGFSVPCTKDCAHVELSGSPKILGRQWISGKYQQVKGGRGILAAVNGGMEPTGRHPFGDAFKVVVTDTDESTGSVNTALYFRICIRKAFVDLGCTSYFLGPIPWFSYHELDPIFLGNVESLPASVHSSSTQAASGANGASGAVSSSLLLGNPNNCGSQHRGISLGAYASAISGIEGGYGSVGPFVSDGAGNKGRGFGRYQLMSYRDDVRSSILSKSGGKEFLSSVDAGQNISENEMLSYFSEADQDALFAADASALLDRAALQIDPTTGQPFTGSRLIERAAQMHFGGTRALLDGGASDAYGRLTLSTYGKQALHNYQSAYEQLGCGRPS